MTWRLSGRADPRACALADRHYNRQAHGTAQFVPPGRCLVLLTEDEQAVWVTSHQQYVQHAWPGAWVNCLFRNEGKARSSDLIRQAVAMTRSIWEPPALGIITFIDPTEVRPTTVRGERIYGYCYRKAGWRHVGYTKGGLWAWQQLPAEMPEAQEIPILQEATSPL